MKQYIFAFLTLLVIAGLLLSVACVSPAPPGEVTPPPTEEKPPEEVAPPPPTEEKLPEEVEPEKELPSFPLTIIDDLGREVTIDEIPQRIVSHVPSITETLFALGLGERVVGVSNYCDYPEAAKLKPSVGNYFTPSIERIVALDPDLVLTDGFSQNIIQLDSLGITYIVLEPKDIGGIVKNIELLGKLTGTEKEAEKLIEDMRNRMLGVSAKVKDAPRVRVFYTFAVTDLNNPWTAGPGSFADSLITMAGGENIVAQAQGAWLQYSIEKMVGSDPEVIIVDTSHGSAIVSLEELKKQLRGHPAWCEMTAVKRDRIYPIDGDLLNRPGPRIVQGLEEMARIIHPEIFGTPETES